MGVSIWPIPVECVCRGLLAAAAEDDEAEGGAVNNLDSASAAGDSPEVSLPVAFTHLQC